MNIQNREARPVSSIPTSPVGVGLASPDVGATLANPRFQKLVRARSTLGWTLAAVMVVVYLGLIALVAFDKPLVAQPVGNGPTSLGIVLGIAVILTAIVLVGIYVAVANTRFDAMSRDLNAEIR